MSIRPAKQNVLITGGAGFIGTHLARGLQAAGHGVRIVDLLHSPRTGRVPGCEYAQGDITQPGVLEQALEGVDQVFHFAAQVSVPLCQVDPVGSYRVNLLGTAQLMKAIDRSGRKTPVVFASSSAVYGGVGIDEKPIPESAPTSPQSFYAAQKLGSEQLLKIARDSLKLPCLAFRFFNVYGHGQDPKSTYTGVISVFANRIREGEPLELHRGGSQTRDFISVHDIVAACEATLSYPISGFDGSVFNLGSGRSVTIRALAEMMREAMSSQVALVPAPAREGDVMHSLADVSAVQKALGWTPQVRLEDGLRELLAQLS